MKQMGTAAHCLSASFFQPLILWETCSGGLDPKSFTTNLVFHFICLYVYFNMDTFFVASVLVITVARSIMFSRCLSTMYTMHKNTFHYSIMENHYWLSCIRDIYLRCSTQNCADYTKAVKSLAALLYFLKYHTVKTIKYLHFIVLRLSC